ncbi:MAG: hypothetical protein ACHQ1H_03925 [Nitrososphaerales archaeon]
MADQPLDEGEITQLRDVYGMLKKDLKDMLFDLLDGVSLWSSTARILFYFSLISFAVGLVFTWGSTFAVDSAPFIALGLGSIAVFMFGLGVLTTVTGVRYRRKYLRLRRKYSELYDAARKLS